MSNIFKISQEYLAIMSEIEQAEGEITEEVDRRLSITQEQLEQKAVDYAYVIRHLDGEAELIEKEIKRLKELKAMKEKVTEKMKERISTAMKIFGVSEIRTATTVLSFRRSKSVEIENESLLDARFVRVKEEKSPDKKAIKEAIENGEVVLGASIKEKENLQIK